MQWNIAEDADNESKDRDCKLKISDTNFDDFGLSDWGLKPKCNWNKEKKMECRVISEWGEVVGKNCCASCDNRMQYYYYRYVIFAESTAPYKQDYNHLGAN